MGGRALADACCVFCLLFISVGFIRRERFIQALSWEYSGSILPLEAKDGRRIDEGCLAFV